jgi:hypothetical protein
VDPKLLPTTGRQGETAKGKTTMDTMIFYPPLEGGSFHDDDGCIPGPKEPKN